ncbi:hypothetical protein BST81_12175 [Leptolyngbya sp. 'hensonii']|uniref:glycosyltransferase family 2 protein n=1 Tax=Leptolyngbya sp. 'hensonii' TaxID=1922337 RepID=UPI0009502950|nr:glycosyltransferase family 2 protein [Leptolyngbya sp. 'hensonii']OLP17817.1 hypothetical protein BST81_12175 [Leptolyngbya sp. 'hensonii']
MRPLVSVLIPCYNADRWLARTLKSVLAQSWNKLEIIVVDDGSTDNSLTIARSFASSSVAVLSQVNQGASAARNRALQVAQGDFIQYLDADDLLSSNKIEAQLFLLQHHPENMLALCNTIHFWDETDPEVGTLETGGHFFANSDRPVEWLIQLLGGDGAGAMVHPAAWLISRAVAAGAGPWNEQLSLDDDGEYFARVVLASAGIRYTPIGCSYYRKYKGGNSLSGGRSDRHQWSALQSIALKADYLLSRTQDQRAKRAIARCYMERAVQAYPGHPHVTQTALREIRQLGVKADLPTCGSWRGELLRFLLGWKLAKRLSMAYHHSF